MKTARALLCMAAVACAMPVLAWHSEWIATSNIPAYDSRSLLHADFNGDGTPDLLSRTLNHDLRLISVESSSLSSAVVLYQGDYLSDAAVGDVNGDGKVDVLASDVATNNLVVLLSHGDGTFAAPVLTALPFAPTMIATGDFNGDGKLDLAVHSYSAAIVAILTGNGSGTFAEVSRYARPTSSYRIVAGDLDHDGHDDVVLANDTPVELNVYYGNGNGTLAAPMSVTGAPQTSSKIAAADLDGDGDLELLSCEFTPNTVTVILNLGSRTFAAPVKYDVFDTPAEYGSPIDFIVGDVTDDGDVDLVVTLANARGMATFAGQGNGALDNPTYESIPQASYYYPSFPHAITAADFTGDGRLDVVVGTSYVERLILMSNASGDSEVSIGSNYPTTSSGQPVTFTVTVLGRDGRHVDGLSGDVVIKDGAVTIGTGTLNGYTAEITVASLPVGVHTMTAHFKGDDLLRPSISEAIEQNVVATPTTVTLTSPTGGQEIPYGTELHLTAAVSSDIPGPLDGRFWLYTDGQRSQYTQSNLNFYVHGLSTGTHTLYVQYEGNPTHPPAKSNVITQVVRKAQTAVEVSIFTTPVQYGTATPVRVYIHGLNGGTPTGTFRIYDSSTLLVTRTGPATWDFIDIPLLAPGVHYLRVVYDGDQNYEPSESSPLKLGIVPAGPLVLDVVTIGSQISAHGWFNGSPYPVSGTHFVIWRRIGAGSWTVLSAYSSYPSWSDYSAQSGTIYAYRIEAYNDSNQFLASSNVDMAMIFTFADDPLRPLMPVKAQHIQELVSATNVLRQSAGLPAIGLLDAAPGQPILASHIESIRTALNEGRAAFAAPAIELSPAVSAGALIRMKDIQELREAFH